MDFKIIILWLAMTDNIEIQADNFSSNEHQQNLILKTVFEKVDIMLSEKDQRMNELETNVAKIGVLLKEKNSRMNQFEVKFIEMVNLLGEKDDRIDLLQLKVDNLEMNFNKYKNEKESTLQEHDLLLRELEPKVRKNHGWVQKLFSEVKNVKTVQNQQQDFIIETMKQLRQGSTQETVQRLQQESTQNIKTFQQLQKDSTRNRKTVKHFQRDSTKNATSNLNKELINFSRSSIRKRVAPLSPIIAFHVSLSHKITPSAALVIKYDRELLDMGNGYNPQEGVYTVPESGVYVLTWATLTDDAYVQTLLLVNGVTKGRSFSDTRQGGEVHSSTAVVVTPLNAGDHVLIQIGYHAGALVYSHTTQEQPSFSGWKLN